MRRWLIEARAKKKLSQDQVATKCGISRQYYNFIESGKRNCPPETAKKIAAVLEFPWTKFFEEDAPSAENNVSEGAGVSEACREQASG